MRYLVPIPIVGIALVLQSAIISRLELLSGFGDLVLVVLVAWSLQEKVRSTWIWAVVAGIMVGYFSSIPWYVYIICYLAVIGIANILRKRIWQAPLLVSLILIAIATLIVNVVSAGYLIINGHSLPIYESISEIILPTILLNLLIIIPVHFLTREFTRLLYPDEVKI